MVFHTSAHFLSTFFASYIPIKFNKSHITNMNYTAPLRPNNCFDDPNFFFYNEENLNCAWISQNKERCSYHHHGLSVGKFCRRTCGNCDNKNHICEDDENFLFSNIEGRYQQYLKIFKLLNSLVLLQKLLS
mmetsp:Transcript_22797/g.52250  ORF Transcript_22797/g.52250 Transcript_22797/m.52250 type:complete len:131 (-) Transcript_22797:1425-1817(-)